MVKTYEVTENEKEAYVAETATASTTIRYRKDWLIEEIARLQVLLNQFPK